MARLLAWGLLILALVAVGAAAVVQWLGRPEPPPVLGTLPDFALVNRDGRTITRADLAGVPWVADFIFGRISRWSQLSSVKSATYAAGTAARRGALQPPRALSYTTASFSPVWEGSPVTSASRRRR